MLGVVSLLALSVAVCDLHAAGALLEVLSLLPTLPALLGSRLFDLWRGLFVHAPQVAALAGVLEPEDLPFQGIHQFPVGGEGLVVELIFPQDLPQGREGI